MNRKLLIGAGALTLALAATGCTIANTEPDQAAIVYDAGPLSSTTYQNCIGPGTRDVSGPSDEHYYYPNGLLTYPFSMESPTSDGANMAITGVVAYNFAAYNPNDEKCTRLKKFHESIGRRLKAYSTDEEPGISQGWQNMEKMYIGNAIDRAMDDATLKYGWRDLTYDPAKKATWEKEMSGHVAGYIKQLAGDDYFSGMTIALPHPKPPKTLADTRVLEQAAIAQNNAQKQLNEKIMTEAEGLKKLVAVLGQKGTVDKLLGEKLIDAINQGKVGMVVVSPNGSPSLVPPTTK